MIPDRGERASQQPGRLTIFLGYARGVGTTRAMLVAGQRLQTRGVDVVVSCEKVGASPSVISLLDAFEQIPLRYPSDRTPPGDLNLDAILKRRPEVVLVTDLHLENGALSRHHKRYQDVEDLLDAGIDVFATLHIHHLESLSDVVRQITELDVQQTVPDRLLDRAVEIEMADMRPEVLIARFEAAEFVPDLPPEDARRFYRPGNLYGLRELALRRAAECVDTRMRGYMQQRAIPGPWAATERLMVCVGPGPLSERLVRAAQRLAHDLNAEWFAVYVQTPGHQKLSLDERDRVWRTLHYAEALGAESVMLTAPDIAESLIEYARRQNVTKIIVGRPLKPLWRDRLSGSIVDRIIRLGRGIDVYVISGDNQTYPEPVKASLERPIRWSHYALALVLVLAATLLGFPIDSFLSPTNLVMLYLVAVVIAATRLGRGPAVLAAFLSVLGFDYFFVPPRLTLVVADTEYLLTFVGLLVVGVVISTLVSQVRERTRIAQLREAQTTTLYALSRELAVAGRVESIVKAVVEHVKKIFAREAVILLPTGSKTLAAHPAGDLVEPAIPEQEVAEWVYQHAQPAGHGTDTLSDASLRYVPLVTSRGVIGVMGVRSETPDAVLSLEQTRLLDVFSSQAALAIERALLVEQAQEAEILKATEQFQTALLNSISHDLRTPLVSITGVLTSLRGDGLPLPEDVQQELVDTAYEEANRLNRLVGNLLNMTRIEGGALHLNREPCDVEDLVGSAMAALSDRMEQHEVRIDLSEGLPLVMIDFVLMNQVLINVLDNAVKYSPTGSLITLEAAVQKSQVTLSIMDRGPGILAADLDRVFEKFYRVSGTDEVMGTGLGLSISKGIVEAHGGCIRAENRAEGGTRIVIALPEAEDIPHPFTSSEFEDTHVS